MIGYSSPLNSFVNMLKEFTQPLTQPLTDFLKGALNTALATVKGAGEDNSSNDATAIDAAASRAVAQQQ